MADRIITGDMEVGVVGLGLMGSSIVVALLIAGHPVKAIAPLPGEASTAPLMIDEHLQLCEQAGLLSHPIGFYTDRLEVSADYRALLHCSLVLECVTENPEIKEAVYKKVTDVVTDSTIMASNTSAIPISILQQSVLHPSRFLGIHWAEPAYMTRFLEITCGNLTDMKYAAQAFEIAHLWGKEPTLLKKDIRGFVTNRLMYSVYREGLSLADKGEATVEDMDKVFRYDAGSWMTLMGVFRRMDYLGLEDMEIIVKNIFPQLSTTGEVPELMKEMIRVKARGTQSSAGFYKYKDGEAREWEESFAAFNRDIDQLAAKYPAEGAIVANMDR